MWIYDFKALLFLQWANFKNTFKALLNNPVTAIKELGEFAFLLIIIVLTFLSRHFKTKSKEDLVVKSNFNNIISNKLIISSIIVGVLILITIIILTKTFVNYKPTYFTIQDVHYLFPSPIGEKTIWAFRIIKSCFEFSINYFVWSIFVCVVILRSLNLNCAKLFMSILGIIFIVLLFKSLNYLLYSLKIKFNGETFIKKLSSITIILMFLYLVITYYMKSVYFSRERVISGFFQLLIEGKGPGFIIHLNNNTPILSSIKNVIIYPITNTSFPMLDFLFIVIIAIIVFVMAIYFAQDFYEDISENIEINNENIATDNLDTMVIEESLSTKKQDVKEKSLFGIKGCGAFFYKSYLYGKRNGKIKRYSKICVITIIASCLLGYFLKDTSQKLILTLIGVMGIILSMNLGIISTIKYELNKKYIYLIPGSIKSKMFFITIYDNICNSVFLISVLLPLGFMTKINNLQVVFFILFIILLSVNINFSKIIANFFVPVDNKSNPEILEGIVKFIVTGIPIGSMILVFKIINNIFIILILGILINILVSALILYMSEKFFKYIELR